MNLTSHFPKNTTTPAELSIALIKAAGYSEVQLTDESWGPEMLDAGINLLGCDAKGRFIAVAGVWRGHRLAALVRLLSSHYIRRAVRCPRITVQLHVWTIRDRTNELFCEGVPITSADFNPATLPAVLRDQ